MNVKEFEKYIIKRGGGNNKIDYDAFPIINGVRCHSIWCPYDFNSTEEELNDPMYINEWSFSSYFSDKNQKGACPPEIRKLFGKQIINGKEQFVQHISFRQDDSGHASYDNIVTIYIAGGSLSVWDHGNLVYDKQTNSMTTDYDISKFYNDHRYGNIHYTDPYFQKVIETLCNKEFEVKDIHIPNSGIDDINRTNSLKEASFLQKRSSALRYIDGMIYPDAHLESWRPYGGQYPYVVAKGSEQSKEYIRVWMEKWNSHVYLQKIKAEEGDSNVFLASFSREWEKTQKYINITTWVDSKENDGGNWISFDIKSNKKAHAMSQGKKQWIRDYRDFYQYKIIRIVESK
ncbi:MAG: hypothetical protein GF317_06480 [Candidatus Lokiarchaeota archaeon]|nr:hypothetical protein [Candidatus Lokiarchaeota archaeon]